MSIEDLKKIDAVGVDEVNGTTILLITDHLPWDTANRDRHLTLVQDKINSYLHYIEEGQLEEEYPISKGTSKLIEIAGKHELSAEGKEFVDVVAAQLSEVYGVRLVYVYKPPRLSF